MIRRDVSEGCIRAWGHCMSELGDTAVRSKQARMSKIHLKYSMLIKISETSKKKKMYIHNSVWVGKLTVWVTKLISLTVTPTIHKFLGDNVLEFHNWTDAESMSIWLTQSLSQSPTDMKSRSKVKTDVKSKSFILRGKWGLIWWRAGMKTNGRRWT